VPPWLITSFGLPVATTTGRLIVVLSSNLSRHPFSAVTVVVGLSMVAAGWRILLHLRHRRALRRGSIS
jgi:hypothetical protein